MTPDELKSMPKGAVYRDEDRTASDAVQTAAVLDCITFTEPYALSSMQREVVKICGEQRVEKEDTERAWHPAGQQIVPGRAKRSGRSRDDTGEREWLV